jgi:hypothetical protein
MENPNLTERRIYKFQRASKPSECSDKFSQEHHSLASPLEQADVLFGVYRS